MNTSSHPVARLLAFGGLVALFASSFQHLRRTHARRAIERPAASPLREQVWEDEGGQNQMPDQPPSPDPIPLRSTP